MAKSRNLKKIVGKILFLKEKLHFITSASINSTMSRQRQIIISKSKRYKVKSSHTLNFKTKKIDNQQTLREIPIQSVESLVLT